MGQTKNAGLTLAVGVLAAVLAEEAVHATAQHRHTPATYFANAPSTGTSASTFNIVDCVAFRALYAETVEVLADDVSERLPRSPITFVLL